MIARCLKINLENDETRYSDWIQIGVDYRVYGLKFKIGRMEYLVSTSSKDRPMWMPSELFELIDAELPPQWSLCLTQTSSAYRFMFEQSNVFAIIGYRELTQNYDHYAGILERDPAELEKFFAVKALME